MDLLQRLASECHEASKSWWYDLKTGERLNRNKHELKMLMISEVSEAMEGERKNLLDDKIVHRRMAEVELADTLIRIFDYCGAFDVELHDCRHQTLNDMAESYRFIRLTENRAENLWFIASCFTSDDDDEMRHAIDLICAYAGKFGYDLDGAVAEKRAYNATRKDHQPAERLKAGGKKW